LRAKFTGDSNFYLLSPVVRCELPIGSGPATKRILVHSDVKIKRFMSCVV